MENRRNASVAVGAATEKPKSNTQAQDNQFKKYTPNLSDEQKDCITNTLKTPVLPQIVSPEKPTPIKYDFDAIPSDFTKQNNWILWKYILNNHKWTKIPYQINGTKADATSQKTWCSFNDAKTAFKSGKFDGIGFAIGKSGLVCIDVDHESQWPNGGLESLLSGLNDKYYKEQSPSGDGYHLWIKASKPNGMGCKSKNFHNSLVEVYNSDRYITMTGAVIKPYIQPQEAQAELENVFSPLIKNTTPAIENTPLTVTHFDDETIINKIKNQNNKTYGSKLFIQLHKSGFATGDNSSDDLSYMNTLAFYTSCNPTQMDRIYRTSAIFRNKWDEKRGDFTYGEITIQKAITDCTKQYDPTYQEDVTFDFSDISKDEIPNEDPFNVKSINLTKPHGFLGEICDEILAMSDRPLPLSYPLTGLHIINQLAKGRLGIDGRKINLMTLLIAPSAYGKDVNLRALSEVSSTFKNQLKSWLNKPRTDVDVIKNMIERLGDCSYKVDEAHSLFQSIKSNSTNTYTANIAAEMLDTATTTLKELSGNHKREFMAQEQKNLDKLNSKYEKNRYSDDKKDLAKWYEKEIKQSETRIEFIENGTPNPTMHMCMFSTPENIDSVATNMSVESGLMGRCLVWRIHGEAQRLKKTEQTAFSLELNQRFKAMNDFVGEYSDPVKLSPDAEQLALDIREFYEGDRYRLHPTKGALYRRMFERVLSVASILGSETGEATTQDLRFALAVTLEHVNNIAFLIGKNSANNSDEDMIKHLMDLILQKVKPTGVAQSIVKNQVLNCCKEARINVKTSIANGKPSFYDQALNFLLDNEKIFYKKGTKKLAC
jgi:hypothetical protein